MDKKITSLEPIDSKNLSGPALRTFFRIADAWGLSMDQQIALLGHPSRATYFNWKKNPEIELSRDTLERLSYLIGIYKALQILLPDASVADAWINKPNTAPLFGGRSALKRMVEGGVSDLFLVRQYLDGQRGGWM